MDLFCNSNGGAFVNSVAKSFTYCLVASVGLVFAGVGMAFMHRGIYINLAIVPSASYLNRAINFSLVNLNPTIQIWKQALPRTPPSIFSYTLFNMKLVSVVLAALAATAVQAGPMNRWCMFPGQVCGKSKRAFDAIDEVKRSADAMAEAQLDLNRWCMFPGEVCGNAKRAIDAIDNVKRSADAVAEAMAFLGDLSDEDYAKIKDAE